VTCGAAGLVVGHRGGHGGYQLSSPPEELRLVELLSAVGPGFIDRDQAIGGTSQPASAEMVAHLWLTLDAGVREYLSGVSLADLASGRLPAWTTQQ
jgi:DNA-binding IscR family transcriptional regulator